MKIIVLVKAVLDTAESRRLSRETGLAERTESGYVLDGMSDRALEAAVAYAESADGVEVVTLMVAPEEALATLRKTLAVGADRALHIVDPDLVGADIVLTAQAIAAAVGRESCDLVIGGETSTDGASGMVPAAVAEWAGLAFASGLDEIEISPGLVSGVRSDGGGVQTLEVDLPAIVSVTEALPATRFPNFKGIMAAKKKPLETLSLADLGLRDDPALVARSIVLSAEPSPPKPSGIKLVDDGTAADQLAEYLIESGAIR
ncbi:electron transfer flavoprotein subunit beta/FixA family protein [Leucobacter celer]|uniref:electron transfer flavoprotein subunit beta/FixA family protein n=1 Tax=Leucobacter celer TaxID=668625 RepID=UPI0006A75CA6|nr:electron transfer flavoprotein subunit beta/FixA family protein [Leucobacter celer]